MNIVSTKFQSFGIYLGALQPGSLPPTPMLCTFKWHWFFNCPQDVADGIVSPAPSEQPLVSCPPWAVAKWGEPHLATSDPGACDPHVGSVRWATSLHQDITTRKITTRKCYWYTYKHIMCSLLSSIHENNCFLFFKRYHMNIYPSATQKLPPTLWTISRASIARMSKSPRRGHIACEFWKIEDVAFIFSVYFMALWILWINH